MLGAWTFWVWGGSSAKHQLPRGNTEDVSDGRIPAIVGRIGASNSSQRLQIANPGRDLKTISNFSCLYVILIRS